MEAVIFVSGCPVAKARPRFARTPFGFKTYTPETTASWESRVRWECTQHRPFNMPEIPVRVELTFLMPRPKSLKKRVQYHTKKPDIDNLSKAVLDGMKQAGMFKDDSYVVEFKAIKEYAIDNKQIGVVIALKYIESA